MNIRENLLTLIAAIEAQPETQFDLSSFVSENDCGTIYCSAGLAASMPFFMDQLRQSKTVYAENLPLGEYAYYVSDQAHMWGPNSNEELFSPRATTDFDEQLLENNPSMTDKELAVVRLRNRLKDYPA